MIPSIVRVKLLQVCAPTFTDRENRKLTYRDIISRVLVKESLDLFRNFMIDVCLCFLPSRMNRTTTWANRCLPKCRKRTEDVSQPLPQSHGSAEGDDYFFETVIDGDEATVFRDLSTWVVLSSDTK